MERGNRIEGILTHFERQCPASECERDWMRMAGRATWAGMPFPCEWMKRGRQLPIRIDRNTASWRAQERNLPGGDLENGLALIFPFTMKNIEKAWEYKVTGNQQAQKKEPRGYCILGAPAERRRLPTLPHCIAVPSAQVGLTSLFGMGRGGTPPQ